MARYPEYRAEPPHLRHQRARHAGRRGRGRRRHRRLRGHHRRRASAPGSSSSTSPASSRARRVTDIEKIWDQMYLVDAVLRPQGPRRSTRSRGVDLALWDLLGQLRGEPVYHAARRRGARRARLLRHRRAARPRQGDGLHRRQDAAAPRPGRGRGGPARATSPQLAEMREKVGDDFWLMLDCWMSLDLDYATPARRPLPHEYGLKWIEEALPPDDYWGYADAAARGAAAACWSPPASTRRPAGASACCSRWAAATSSSPTSAGAAASPSCSRSPRSPTRTACSSCRTARASTATTSSSPGTTARSPSS